MNGGIAHGNQDVTNQTASGTSFRQDGSRSLRNSDNDTACGWPASDVEPSWFRGLKSKRPLEWMRALTYLMEAGLKNGQVTANDIPEDIYFEQPNVIGASFKDLRHFGFRKTNVTIKAKAAKKHGRDLPIWELVDSMAAKRWIRAVKRLVLDRTPVGQMEML